MSKSPDDAMAECQPESSRSSLSGSSNGPREQSTTHHGPDADNPGAPTEKTISCVSCRKRKLKCDRLKPKCGTCTRLRHECEYPERRRNLGSKRRNMKELEARLAQVETQLVAETTKGTATSQAPAVHSTEPDWNDYTMDMNMDMGNVGMLDESFDIPLSAFDFQPAPPVVPEGDFFSQELISLGLSEPLPPQEMIDELHDVYFSKFHPTMPMMHKYRYLASLNLPAHMQPPVCLRYAVWASAASVTEKYLQYEDVLYARARKYVEEAEMKGHGETFVTIRFAQTWGLIATYEAKKTYFTRAWMSTGRMTRLTQMLGLQRLDAEGQDVKRILPPAKDWIELEERRRVFWAAFYGDRWASSGTGWPMIIVENEIQTNLPASEESFENGIVGDTIPLSEALTPEGASRISPFGGVILSACLFGHNFQHLHKVGPDERPDDLANGEFWKRHRKMDNVLSNTFMFLPDHLRLPGGLRDMNVVFLHMNIHASTICLHQAAVLTAEKNNISQSFIRQCRTRSLMAAEEIANTMRLVSHLDASNMNSWMGFCLYVAGGVFIQDQRGGEGHSQSITNLEFILAAMKAIGNRHSITNHFTAQIEIDIESSGIRPHSSPHEKDKRPNIPINGLLPVRNGVPMTVEELRSYSEASSTSYTNKDGSANFEEICPYISSMARGSMGRQTGTVVSPLQGILPSMRGLLSRKTPEVHRPPEGLLEDHVHPSFPNWNPPANSALDGSQTLQQNTRQHQQRQSVIENSGFTLSNSSIPPDPNVSSAAGVSSSKSPESQTSFKTLLGIWEDHAHPSFPGWQVPGNGPHDRSSTLNQNTQQQAQQKQQGSLEPHDSTSSNPPVPAQPSVVNGVGSPFDFDSFLAGNTSSSDSSGSNTIQYPYRQADSNNSNRTTGYSMFEADPSSYITASDWTSDIPFNTESQDGGFGFSPQPSDAARRFTGTESWGQNPGPSPG